MNKGIHKSKLDILYIDKNSPQHNLYKFVCNYVYLSTNDNEYTNNLSAKKIKISPLIFPNIPLHFYTKFAFKKKLYSNHQPQT